MPRTITPRQEKYYYVARDDGFSMREAIAQPLVNISLSKARDLEKKRNVKVTRDRAALEEGRLDENLPMPKPYEKMNANAQRAFHEFDFFQRYYLGRVSQPWQVEAAEKVATLLATPRQEYLVVNCPPGAGKALALDTPLATPTGWTTMGKVRIGDLVFDDRGEPTRVMFKSEVFYGHDCYEVATDDGATLIADGDHLWPVRLHGYGLYGRKVVGQQETVKAHTTEFLSRPRSKRPQLAMTEPLHIRGTHLPINPYVLGAWLGDGDTNGGRMSCHPDDAKFIRGYFEAAGFRTTDHKAPINFGVLGLSKKLRVLGVKGNKHIPCRYLRASAPQRLALLQGLVDTDGHVSGQGLIEFTSTNWHLAKGVQFLARSLGVKASIREGIATIDGRDCGPKWRVMFMLADGARLPRKAILTRNGVRTPNRYLTVTAVDSVPTQCIQVDSPSHLFLAGEGLMVTHNTTLMTHDIPCWLTIRDRAVRGLMGSATQQLSNRNLMRLRRTLERPALFPPDDKLIRQGLAVKAEGILTVDFGRFKPLERAFWTQSAFTVLQPDAATTVEKEPTWSAYGMDSGYIGGRFDFTGWDDLVDPKKLRSQESKENLERDWTDVAENRLEPEGLLALVGQRLTADDLYRFCLDMKSGADDEWDDDDEDAPGVREGERAGMKYHHIKFKAHYEDRCTPENHKRGAPSYPDGCLLSSWRLPWRQLKPMLTNSAERFEVVYQQEDTADSETLVPKNWIYGDSSHYGCLDHDRDVLEVPKGLTGLQSYVSVDPSPTQYWGITWWLYHPESEQRFLFNLENRKMDATDLLDFNYNAGTFYGIMEEWQQVSHRLGVPISHWIVEINAAQRFLLQYDHTQRWVRRNSVEILPHSTAKNKSDPAYGIWTIRTHYEFGRVRLPYRQGTEGRAKTMRLVNELVRYPNGRTDDLTMSHWFLEWQLPHIYAPRRAMVTQARPSWMLESA